MFMGTIPGFIGATPLTYVWSVTSCPGACLAVWVLSMGMHSPCDAAAHTVRAELQRLYSFLLP